MKNGPVWLIRWIKQNHIRVVGILLLIEVLVIPATIAPADLPGPIGTCQGLLLQSVLWPGMQQGDDPV